MTDPIANPKRIPPRRCRDCGHAVKWHLSETNGCFACGGFYNPRVCRSLPNTAVRAYESGRFLSNPNPLRTVIGVPRTYVLEAMPKRAV